jgi:hypothetical protein
LPLLLASLLPAVAGAQISVEVSANVAPPDLPVYDQPPIPGDGYLWTPGYWAWSDDIQDYYWVPGTWVLAPQPAYLWTPGYWSVDSALFLWHPGYWGPQVGFYGGVNYGYGYGGMGYEGGYWQGNHLYYNRAVNNINNVAVTNVYNKTVVNNVTVNRVSYNGGNGIQARPTAAQMAAGNERHIPATAAQQQQIQMAQKQPGLRAAENHGHPPIAATPRPGAFAGPGVVGTRPSGSLSVVHQNPPPRESPPPRDSPPPRENAVPRPAPGDTAEQTRRFEPQPPPARPPAAAPPPPPPPPRAVTPPPPPPHPAPPEPHAAPPHPQERSPEHDHRGR